MFSPQDKADVLTEALPYIQKFFGKTIVIKYGGNAMVSDDLKKKVIMDITLMKFVGIRPVIVHGGGPDITGFLKKIGKKSEFVSGLRVTDEETMEVVEMVLIGKVNSEIVNLLNQAGNHAIGLSGKDASLIEATKKFAEVHNSGGRIEKVDIGHVGEVKSIHARALNDMLDNGYIPVVAPIGVGGEGESYNINADYVAAKIAGALKAEKLLLLTDVEGVYKDYADKSSFISSITEAEIRRYINDGTISGGMIPKVEACLDALGDGAHKTSIIDGRLPHSLLLELFTEQGIGTEIVK
ncbi:MAG: acetylglutamate kinase [Schwartzia sp.]|nr:acetylglutamate kinase [Schwartzia sp. (in: firmicutes)]